MTSSPSTLSELADELEVSRQTVSERLRRSYAYLVQDTLFLGDRSPPLGTEPSDGDLADIDTGSNGDATEWPTAHRRSRPTRPEERSSEKPAFRSHSAAAPSPWINSSTRSERSSTSVASR